MRINLDINLQVSLVVMSRMQIYSLEEKTSDARLHNLPCNFSTLNYSVCLDIGLGNTVAGYFWSSSTSFSFFCLSTAQEKIFI